MPAPPGAKRLPSLARPGRARTCLEVQPGPRGYG